MPLDGEPVRDPGIRPAVRPQGAHAGDNRLLGRVGYQGGALGPKAVRHPAHAVPAGPLGVERRERAPPHHGALLGRRPPAQAAARLVHRDEARAGLALDALDDPPAKALVSGDDEQPGLTLLELPLRRGEGAFDHRGESDAGGRGPARDGGPGWLKRAAGKTQEPLSGTAGGQPEAQKTQGAYASRRLGLVRRGRASRVAHQT